MSKRFIDARMRPSAGYPLYVEAGVLRRLPALLGSHADAARYALITDETVAALHAPQLQADCAAAGLRVDAFVVPAGEASKTRDAWTSLTDRMLAAGIGRDACVVAFGGGVIGDLAGFVAATYMRGVPVVQVPTTLLAMVDASVGGKTGVDTPAGKNLVGAFHPPKLVVADPAVLATLPAEELRAGLAEAVKHGAIADAAHLEWIAARAGALVARAPDALGSLVEHSIAIKSRVVEADPVEHGERAMLNFGHTVGHALEQASGYALRHGDAVAIGMVVEAQLGEALRVTEAGTAETLRGVLARCGLPVGVPPQLDASAAIAAAATDKKNRAGEVRVVLLARAGAVARAAAGQWTHAVEAAALRAAIERCTAGNPLPAKGL